MNFNKKKRNKLKKMALNENMEVSQKLVGLGVGELACSD